MGGTAAAAPKVLKVADGDKVSLRPLTKYDGQEEGYDHTLIGLDRALLGNVSTDILRGDGEVEAETLELVDVLGGNGDVNAVRVALTA